MNKVEQIDLQPIMTTFFKNMMRGFNYCIPARIDGVQFVNEGRIDVKPLYMPTYGDNTTQELPIIKNVPYIVPCFNQSGMICTPQQGDTVILQFAQCNIDKFKNGSIEPYDTNFQRFLNINDAIAFCGFNPFTLSPIKKENHSKDYDVGDVSLYNNLNKESENKINIKKNGDIEQFGKDNKIQGETLNIKVESGNVGGIITFDDDIIIGGVSLKQFIQSHTHSYTDDGRPMTTGTPNAL